MSLEIEVYDRENPFIKKDIIPNRVAPKFLDEMKGVGGGSFDISTRDKRIVSNSSLLDDWNVVKCKVDGKVRGAFLIQSSNETYVDSGEASDETVSIAGEGLKTWFRNATLYPYGGLKTLSSDDRAFSWASEQGDWYHTADWVPAVNVAQYLSATAIATWSTAPQDWPDAPLSQWIWDRSTANVSAPVGTCYFRFEFDTLVDQSVSFFFAADNQFEVYVDAQQIIQDLGASPAWVSNHQTDVKLLAGHHIVAVKASNQGGPAALIGAILAAGDATTGTPATLISYTGAPGWKVNSYPAIEPGWTPGEIILKIMDEAEGRGVRFPTWLTPTFTSTHDSNGALWDNPQPWIFNVGDEYLNIIEKLEELYCDIWIDPDTYFLYAWKSRGIDRSVSVGGEDPVSIRVAKNVLKAGETKTSAIKNVLLVKTSEGWIVKEDPDLADSPFGRSEGKLQTDLGLALANDVALLAFDQIAQPETSASFDFLDTADVVPFDKFQVGDHLLAPGKEVLEKRRVVSIALSEAGDTGKTQYAVEFDTIYKDNEERINKALNNLSNGTGFLGSLANVSAAGGSGGVKSSLPSGGGGTPGGGGSVTIPTPPTGLVGSSTGVWTPPGDSVAQIRLAWSPVTTDTTGASMTPYLYEIWARRNRTLSQRTVSNLCANPSFETGLAGVGANSGTTATQSNTWSKYGTYSLKLSPSATPTTTFATLDGGPGGFRSGLSAGNTFTASSWIHLGSAQGGTPNDLARTISIVYVDSGSVTRTVTSAQAPNAAGDYLISVQASIPAGALAAWVMVYNGSNSTTPVDVFFDGIMVVAGTTLHDYVDGSRPSDDVYSYAWAGTAHASTSIRITADKKYLLGSVQATGALLRPLPPGEDWFFGIIAVSTSGGRSAQSAEVAVTTAYPDETVPAPSAPSLASKYGIVRAVWDGNLDGRAPESHFGFVFAETSVAATGPWSPTGQPLTQTGTIVIPGQVDSTTVYVHLVAVDNLGRKGAPSAPVAILVSDTAGSGGGGSSGLAAMPAGMVTTWAGTSAPAGWLMADGSAVSRSTYADLFGVIGTTYGAGDGSTTFNVPNLKGNVPVGRDSAQTEFSALGQVGGSKSHYHKATGSKSGTVLAGDMRAAIGAVNGDIARLGYVAVGRHPDAPSVVASYSGTFGTVSSTSYTVNHNTPVYGETSTELGLQPYVTLNYIVKYTVYDGLAGSVLPAGSIQPWPSDTIPANWVLCNGQAISRTTFASLFATIGTVYGVGDGSTTFNVPDFRGRTLVGKDATQTEFTPLGKTGGEKAHTLTLDEIPKYALWLSTASYSPGVNTLFNPGSSFGISTLNGAATAAHNVLQPYSAVNYIMKTSNGDTPGDSQLTTRVSNLEADSGWIKIGDVGAPAYSSGWSSYVDAAVPWSGLYIRKIGNTVHYAGAAQKSGSWTNLTVVFVFPVGWRPSVSIQGISTVVRATGEFATAAGTTALAWGGSFPVG